MTALDWAWLVTGLWVAHHVVIALRFFRSPHLGDVPPVADPDAPLLSIIVPARNEAHNIGRCLGSLLQSQYPNLEILVVDDHSTDGTGDIARRMAADDTKMRGAPRVRVLDAPPLPDGWFGKQWACHTGAKAARGEVLLFTDADTVHGADLHGRSVAGMHRRHAGLFTVVGRQELGSFWEKVIQPFVFALIFVRFNGLEAMNRSTNPRSKIANGQFLLLSRTVYDAIGRHEAVREHVAEDLMLAQRACAAGHGVHMVLARDHLSTRMYTSLAEIRRGWRKNIFAAGRDTLPDHPLVEWGVRIGAAPFVLIASVPAVLTVLLALGVIPAAFAGPILVALGSSLLIWLGIYGYGGYSVLWVLLHPLAAVMVSGFFAEAAWRGDRVEWKGRAYVSRRG